MLGPDIEFVAEWRLPFLPGAAEGAPVHIVDACYAVATDLGWRRDGPDVSMATSTWTISLEETGDCVVGLNQGARPRHTTPFEERLGGFRVWGLRIEQSFADAAVVIADALRGELAGYPPWIQWPIEDKRLLLPVVRDGRPVWRDPRTETVVAEIGLLGPRGS